MAEALSFGEFGSMLGFHIGARQLEFDFTPAQRRLLRSPGAQALILLSMFYVGTRSWLKAWLLLSAFMLCKHVLINEHSRFNVLPRQWLSSQGLAAPMAAQDSYYAQVETLKRRVEQVTAGP